MTPHTRHTTVAMLCLTILAATPAFAEPSFLGKIPLLGPYFQPANQPPTAKPVRPRPTQSQANRLAQQRAMQKQRARQKTESSPVAPASVAQPEPTPAPPTYSVLTRSPADPVAEAELSTSTVIDPAGSVASPAAASPPAIPPPETRRSFTSYFTRMLPKRRESSVSPPSTSTAHTSPPKAAESVQPDSLQASAEQPASESPVENEVEVVREWHDNGSLRRIRSMRFTKGVYERHGVWDEWHENGKQKVHGLYAHDQPTGKFRWWHPNGLPSIEGEFADGQPNGVWTWWYENGQTAAQGEFQNGAPKGHWTSWDPNGNLTNNQRAVSGARFATQPDRRASLFGGQDSYSAGSRWR